MSATKKPAYVQLLTASSMVLLFGFQVVWLGYVYREERRNLHKELETLFRATNNSLQDSLMKGRIMPFWPGNGGTQSHTWADSAEMRGASVQAIRHLFFETYAGGGTVKDSSFVRIYLRSGNTQAQHNADDTSGTQRNTHSRTRAYYTDSLPRLSLPPNGSSSPQWLVRLGKDSLLAGGMDSSFQLSSLGNMPGLIIRLDGDTLSAETLSKRLRQTLDSAGLPGIGFELTWLPRYRTFYRYGSNPAPSPPDPDLMTARVRNVPAFSGFEARFSQYDPVILFKMLPQGAFSFFLLLSTGLSFYFIYRSLAREQQLARLRSDLISNITHELKTPVATVSVALEALANFNVMQNPTLTKEYLSISRAELDRLALLIERVMNTAAFEQQSVQLRQTPTDLKAVAQRVMDSLRLQFEKVQANVRLTTEGENWTAPADETHLAHVLYNLLDNALKYTPRQPDIHLLLKDLPHAVQLTVTDNGVGIAPEYKNRIFEKFFRAPSGNIHTTKGHGLGLSYVAQVVAQHGGTVTVQSEPGAGSSFTVTLPR